MLLWLIAGSPSNAQDIFHKLTMTRIMVMRNLSSKLEVPELENPTRDLEIFFIKFDTRPSVSSQPSNALFSWCGRFPLVPLFLSSFLSFFIYPQTCYPAHFNLEILKKRNIGEIIWDWMLSSASVYLIPVQAWSFPWTKSSRGLTKGSHLGSRLYQDYPGSCPIHTHS